MAETGQDFKTIEEEIQALRKELNDNQLKTRKNDNFEVITIILDKFVWLQIVLQDNYPNMWPYSVKLRVPFLNTLKRDRKNKMQDLLKAWNLELNTVVDENERKCCVVKIYSKLKGIMALNREYLNETLSVLEAQLKKNRMVIDEQELFSTEIDGEISPPASVLKNISDNEEESTNKNNKKNKKNTNKAKKTEEEDEDAKQKFKGSDYIFQRIKWDDNIDKDQIIIGYLDRFLGVKEIKFNDFKGVHEDRDGIPLHRIRHFKINDKIVWDRENKIDLMTGSGDISKFFKVKKSELIAQNNDDDYYESKSAARKNPSKKSLQVVSNSLIRKFNRVWEEVNTSTNIYNETSFVGSFDILTYNLMSKNNFKKSIISKMNFKKSTAEVLNRNEYDKDELGLKGLDKIDRMEHICKSLESLSPCFVLLQECDEYEEHYLCDNSFIQKNYYICSPDRWKDDVEHPNCIILSKLKPKYFKLIRFSDNSNKAALVAKFLIKNTSLRRVEEIVLANVHLTSNKSSNFTEKRINQLRVLRDYLVDRAEEFDFTADYLFIGGDFNFGDDAELVENDHIRQLFLDDGFIDLAKNVCTFDPSSNFSASITAFKTIPRRLDRILLKKKNPYKVNPTLVKTTLINTSPFKLDLSPENEIKYEPYLEIKSYIASSSVEIGKQEESKSSVGYSEFFLHPSDHYGIKLDFEFKNSLTEKNLEHKSSLAFIMPKHDSDEFVQQVRAKHDAQFNRWPPHFNLLYPFYHSIDLDLNDDEEYSVIADILEILEKYEPFECKLEKLNTFAPSKVVYLEPCESAVKQMRMIYKDLWYLFKSVKSTKWRNDLTPHMTIAQPADKKESSNSWANDAMNKIKNEFKTDSYGSFTIDCLHWITRDETSPFQIKYSFPLGSRYPSTIIGLNPSNLDDSKSVIGFLNLKNMLPSLDEDSKLVKKYQEVSQTIVKSLLKSIYAPDTLKSSNHSNKIEFEIKSPYHALISVGSYQHGVKCNDLDFALFKCSSKSNESFSRDLAYQLAQRTSLFHIVRDISDANVPIIELCLKTDEFEICDGADLQIQGVSSSNFELSQNDKQLGIKKNLFFNNFSYMSSLSKEIPEYSKFHAISGLFENQNLKKFIRNYKDYQILITFVKHWAKSRNIYSKACGFLGGISWSIMIIYFLEKTFSSHAHIKELNNDSDRYSTLLKDFFNFYADFNWHSAISLVNYDFVMDNSKTFQTRSSMMILQSVFPYHNTSKNVSEQCKKIIENEIKRAADIFEKHSKAYDEVCKKVSISEMPTTLMAFKIEYNNTDDLNHIFTVMKGKIQGLVTSLQRSYSPNIRAYANLFSDKEDLEKFDTKSEKFKNVQYFFIGLNDNITFDYSTKEVVRDYAINFIKSVKTLTHTSDYEITLQRLN